MTDTAPADAPTTVLSAVTPRRTATHVSDVALPVSIALWAIGVSRTNATTLGPFGLPAQLPVVFYAGVALLVLSAVIELTVKNTSQWRMGLHAVGLVVMLYGTAALVYPEGRYAWLYKTIGVVQYVNVHGQLDSTIDIYQNWPGFFALAAWFGKVAGVGTPLAYAKWAQLVFELAALPLLYLIYDALSLTFRQRWMALLLYPAANWIGQDYFSPQGLGTVLSLGIMAITMHWLFTGNRAPFASRRRWLGSKRVTAPGPADRQAPAFTPEVKEADQPARPDQGPPGVVAAAADELGAAKSPIEGATMAGFRQRLAYTLREVWDLLRSGEYRAALVRVVAAVPMAVQAGICRVRRARDRIVQGAVTPRALKTRVLQMRGARADRHASLPAGQEPGTSAKPSADLLVPRGRRAAFLVTILLLYFVLTFTHELSPYIVAVQLVVLAAARPLRPRWLPLAMLAIAVGYLLPRLSYVSSHYGLLGSLGSFFSNAAPPSADSSTSTASIPASQVLIQRCAEGLSVTIWLLALVGAWRLRHSGRIVLALVVLTYSPVLVIFGQSYGNEGILRVYLFSLPWAAALAAAAIEPGPLTRAMVPRLRAPAGGFDFSWVKPALRWLRAPVGLWIVLAMFFVAFFGDDAFDTFPRTEVTAILSFQQRARPGPVYVAEDNVPAQDTALYHVFSLSTIFGARDGAPVVNQVTPDIAALVAKNATTYTHGRQPAYVLIALSMVPYNTAYAQAPPDSFTILRKSLARSREWKLIVNQDGTIIYELPPGAGAAAGKIGAQAGLPAHAGHKKRAG